jgi:hypothetical protein
MALDIALEILRLYLSDAAPVYNACRNKPAFNQGL